MTATSFDRKRRRKPGDIVSLRRTLWGAILEIEDTLATAPAAEKVRAAHCLATLAGSYLRCLEAAELVVRVEELERERAGVKSIAGRAS